MLLLMFCVATLPYSGLHIDIVQIEDCEVWTLKVKHTISAFYQSLKSRLEDKSSLTSEDCSSDGTEIDWHDIKRQKDDSMIQRANVRN